MQPNERKLYVQILGQVLIADGALSDAERTYLDGVMDALQMSADERRAAFAGISVDSPIEERVAGLGASARDRLRGELARAVDGGDETAILERVRAALA
ncbi:hypothetical protein [Sandaracinus amylolyticus]|uniref:Co-chaperone DjlA N-terminal domain-containing protein n=1 Tax=Sandaracinus amylolyticus TaxID=927083 RepID=A0A0F6YHF3_9BACT|nr:hypothetical protein [Sandaracinus amylolyticus]AKF03957.1 hypothetical protein DB32_001106 [Sandaracinus amylolyticus]